VLSKEEGGRYLVNMFWGFVAPWGEEKEGKITFQANIRDDTIKKNRFFHDRLLNNRCIFIADGFYEWQKPEGFENLKRGERLPKGVKKTPFRIRLKDKESFPLAGLWRNFKQGEKTLTSAAIITTGPNSMMKSIHDRMPVILSSAELDIWLDSGFREFEPLHELLDSYPSKEMEAYPVSSAVNNSRFDSPACIEPAL